MDNLSKRALLLKEIFQQLDPGSFLDVIDAPPDKVPQGFIDAGKYRPYGGEKRQWLNQSSP